VLALPVPLDWFFLEHTRVRSHRLGS
jgi:hypothetical protein